MLMSNDDQSESSIQKQSKKEIKAALEMYQQWRHKEKVLTSDSFDSHRFFYDDSFSNTERMNQCALVLKANLELLKSNPRKAMKLCTEARAVAERMREENLKLSSELENSRQKVVDESQYFNNMACLHFNAGKFNSSLYYFREALKLISISDEKSSNDQDLFTEDGRSFAPSLSEVMHTLCVCVYDKVPRS